MEEKTCFFIGHRNAPETLRPLLCTAVERRGAEGDVPVGIGLQPVLVEFVGGIELLEEREMTGELCALYAGYSFFLKFFSSLPSIAKRTSTPVAQSISPW